MGFGIISFWIILAILVGVYAASKGRSGVGFFFLATLLSPLIAFIIALVVAPIRANTDARAVETGEFKKCPFCAELVRAEAIVCKHCSRDLPKREVKKVEVASTPVARAVCFDCRHYEAKGWDKSAGKCTEHQKRVKASDTCADFTRVT